ncbi:MAG: family serine peptidase, partial [Solirubrobacterales bacterium]|nr:family serine peptidase [Solirubrobacterales bacterium]
RATAGLAALAALGTATLPAPAVAAPAPRIVPSDDLYPEQAALQPGAGIGAPEAWKLTMGAGVVVAVLDTGVDAAHPDLRGALWTNPGEIPGNGRDDDEDGHVDDVHGVDLVNDDGDPADDEGHGTHVAGIVAARMDGAGVVGLAPEALLMPIKVLDDKRAGNTDTVAAGIRYALAHGAHVINVSVNGPAASPALAAAVREATRAGVTIVASAGNGGSDLSLQPSYPASYDAPSVLAVGATDGDSLLAPFSNFGQGVALTAPGVDILSTARGNRFELRSGTSMAAPEVAAALALLRGARPDLPAADLRDALVQSARRPDTLLGRIGGGALDVAAALHRIVPEAQWPTVPDPPALAVRVKRRSTSAERPRALLTWTVSGDTSAIVAFRVTRSGGATLARRSGNVARGAWISLRRGTVTVAALGADGSVLARVRKTL